VNLKTSSVSVTILIAFVAGCASPPPPKNPPAQVQVNFNFTPQGQLGFSQEHRAGRDI
jgi:hypothetical protein